uniref:hypothetical protein n=1 Tax=Dorea longicatena TaxID=88431 RepID=UPI001A9AD174
RLFHIHWNAFPSFIPCVSNALRMNGKCVTVVDFTGLHFRAFYLLTSAASHDLKETIDKDYCECGMPLETIRESEAPLKERSERV